MFHLTGTDEHGLKLQRAAEGQGMTAQAWSTRWSRAGARSGPGWRSRYDDYIRTTEARHTAAVQQLLKAVHDNGNDDIYLGTYEGLYCVSCEAYYTEDELIEGPVPDPRKARSSASPRRTTSSASPRTRTGCSSITPEDPERGRARDPPQRDPRSLIRGGLRDFSISRTNFDWGIPLPWDPKPTSATSGSTR